jgi:dUTPase
MLIQKVEFFPIEEVQELDETDRGVGGFGSTGK